MTRMGVVFPQTEFGHDPAAVRDYIQTAEALGYAHVLMYDHVLGANPNRPEGFSGPYTYQSSFLEPFVLIGFMAAITTTIEFAPGIIILPQRQTALVAKQAATLDVLSNGRLRLGIGIGWNRIEYTALNEDFHTRGKRVEEQIAVLRQLWTQPLVNFTGRWHTIPDAGLNPLPVQRPIPIWFGGSDEHVLRRIATLGDGWMPNFRTVEQAKPALEKLDDYLAVAGRTRAQLGIEPRVHFGDGNADAWRATIHDWEAAGATHFSLNTMGFGYQTAAAHIAAIRKFAETMGIKRGA